MTLVHDQRGFLQNYKKNKQSVKCSFEYFPKKQECLLTETVTQQQEFVSLPYWKVNRCPAQCYCENKTSQSLNIHCRTFTRNSACTAHASSSYKESINSELQIAADVIVISLSLNLVSTLPFIKNQNAIKVDIFSWKQSYE